MAALAKRKAPHFLLLLSIAFILEGCGESGMDKWKADRQKREALKLNYLSKNDERSLAEIEQMAINGSSEERMGTLITIASIIREKQMIPPTTKPILINSLSSTDVYIRREAAIAINELNGEFLEAIPALMDVVKTYPGSDAAVYAVKSLGNMGKKAEIALPVLKSSPKDTGGSFPRNVLEAIERIEGSAQPVTLPPK